MRQVGILAVQGAFAEQARAFREAGGATFEIRQLSDLEKPMDALVLPGGESTVQGKLLKDLGLFEPLRTRIAQGLPVFATCAGLILLAEHLVDDPTVWFGVLPATVRRNAYGRQLGSFATRGPVGDMPNVPMTFIRAPAIETVSPEVEVLSRFGDQPTGVRHGNIWAFTWHPELTDDLRIFRRFLAADRRAAQASSSQPLR